MIQANNVTLRVGKKALFEDVNIKFTEGNCYGLIGANGAGKSTFLKILSGVLETTNGDVTITPGQRLSVLEQDHFKYDAYPVMDTVIMGNERLYQIMKEKDAIYAKEDFSDEDGIRASELEAEFAEMDGWDAETNAAMLLNGLGIETDMHYSEMSTLNGNEKVKVLLAKALFGNPDILLLDEPTNHLDLSSIAWLETYLLNYKGAVIVVSHDRYFLDRIATKVIELDNARATVFSGNYSAYAAGKEMLRTAAYNAYMKQQQEIKHQEAVIEKLKSFNREKSIKRAESREKMLEKIEVLEKPTEVRADMHLKLEPKFQSGNDVLQVEGLSKAFGPLSLFDGLSFELKKGEHVAIIGDNGTGKTTILKIINELLPPDSGVIRLGANVAIGYYDQEHHVLHPEKTLFQEISDDYPNLNNTEIRNTLAAFLFTGEDVFKVIKTLSGGERGRLSLAKLMLSEANFLILDEPTNHLDIMSKEILEDALNAYTGTVLYVSHDRYFINKTAHRILDLNRKTLTGYLGNYDYYLEKKDEQLAKIDAAASAVCRNLEKEGRQADTGSQKTGLADASIDAKQDWKIRKEQQAAQRKRENDLKKCESEIEALEARNTEIETLMASPEICTDVARLQELNKEKEEIDEKLTDLMEKWELLSE